MKKLLLILFSIIMLSVISINAEIVATGKQGDCITLPQSYANSSFVYINTFQYPNLTYKNVYQAFTKNTGGFFNYTFCDTKKQGIYYIHGIGDMDGTNQTFNYEIEITATGESIDSFNLSYAIIWLMGFVGLYFVFLYKKENNLYKFTGSVLIFLNGLLGLFIFDNPLTWFIMLCSLLFMFKHLMIFMEDIMGE